jgi:hypothetical protein
MMNEKNKDMDLLGIARQRAVSRAACFSGKISEKKRSAHAAATAAAHTTHGHHT